MCSEIVQNLFTTDSISFLTLVLKPMSTSKTDLMDALSPPCTFLYHSHNTIANGLLGSQYQLLKGYGNKLGDKTITKGPLLVIHWSKQSF